MSVEFRVYNVLGDLLGVHDTQDAADAQAEREREACLKLCGDPNCGTLDPHGIFVSIIEDGEDVTASDYGQYR